MASTLPFHFPVILGWDAAGVVEQVGAAVTWFRPGDEVYGYFRRHHLQYGTYAEYATVPEGFFAHMPPGLSFEEAAAMPLAALTAHQALERARAARRRDAVRRRRRRRRRPLRDPARRGARRARRRDGLRGQPRLPARARGRAARLRGRRRPRAGARAAGRRGADAALDLFGGDVREQAFASLRRGGRLVSIAQPPPEPRDGTTRSTTCSAPERLRPRRARDAAGRRGQAARAVEGRSRSSAPPTRTSGSRAGTCAASSCSPSTEAQARLVGEDLPALRRGVGRLLVGPLRVRPLGRVEHRGSTSTGAPVTSASVIASLGRASTAVPFDSTTSA